MLVEINTDVLVSKPIIKCFVNGYLGNAAIDTGSDSFSFLGGEAGLKGYGFDESNEFTTVNKVGDKGVKCMLVNGSMIIKGINHSINIQGIKYLVEYFPSRNYNFLIPYSFLKYFDLSMSMVENNKSILTLRDNNVSDKIIYNVKYDGAILKDVLVRDVQNSLLKK